MSKDLKPSEDFSSRLKAARGWRDSIKPKLIEVYRFCAPGRQGDFDTPSLKRKTQEETDTFTSIGEELATDLAGDMVTYYMPSTESWFELEVIAPVAQEMADQILAIVNEREQKLKTLIESTNLYDIATALMFECATHGTPAIWIDASHIQQPIHCEVVPPDELLVTPGHLGILDRFRESTVYANTIPALFANQIALQEVRLPADDAFQKKLKSANELMKVIWGFWVDWSDPGRPQWRCEITVDGKRVTPEEPLTLGPLAGSCPLLVGRFNPQGKRPWGRGAGIKSLPDFRTLDTITDTVLSGLDQSLMNTLIMADDGYIDMEDGIEAGRVYFGARGFTRDHVYDLSRNVNVDQGFFTEERFEDRLRRAFYQDGPRQRGETPPTAAQWLDERRRVQQRLSKPSAPVWTELILPMVRRFETLAVKLSLVQEALTHNGQAINVRPISPMQKAQNQDKVMTTRSNLELVFNVAGEQTPAIVDLKSTLQNVIKSSGDELLVLNEGNQDGLAAPTAAPPQ